VTRRPRKYALDTNLFVDGFRDSRANAELQRFHQLFGPFEYLSAVVAAELRAGARSAADLRRLERWVIAPFERRARVITPSYRAWAAAGDALAALARDEGLEVASVSKSFLNDVLLAASCREAGCVVVTRNLRDFARIARVAPCDYVGAWPRA
jgi:predicted nucleic acid-binding protein